ncbi:IS3 family transposase, partial [Escherichia coli]|uniref:IS3 family transposase n=1 Tax=Escherichia coli TaxID=562 RepID=UPI003CFF53A1
QFAYDGSQLLTIFEIKLNGADFFFFSKHVLSPESPGNRPHPHYCLISLALTPDRYQSARALVLKIYHQHKGRYGYRRIRLACRNEGVLLNGKT